VIPLNDHIGRLRRRQTIHAIIFCCLRTRTSRNGATKPHELPGRKQNRLLLVRKKGFA
jgi:hypothetical protein